MHVVPNLFRVLVDIFRLLVVGHHQVLRLVVDVNRVVQQRLQFRNQLLGQRRVRLDLVQYFVDLVVGVIQQNQRVHVVRRQIAIDRLRNSLQQDMRANFVLSGKRHCLLELP